jgi:hypothetical protein
MSRSIAASASKKIVVALGSDPRLLTTCSTVRGSEPRRVKISSSTAVSRTRERLKARAICWIDRGERSLFITDLPDSGKGA